MFRTRFRRRSKPRVALASSPPHPWPIDPALSRRLVETSTRLEHTRRQLARHAPPKRRRRAKRST